MNTIQEQPECEICSAKHPLRPVHFYYGGAPDAKSVEVTGDFSHWRPLPMQRRIDGCWFAEVLLRHGHHQYRFLVDGRPVLDPRAAGTAPDAEGRLASLVAVG